MYNPKALLSMAVLLGTALAQTTNTGGGGTTATGGNGAECTRSYAQIIASAPKPDRQLASAITSFAGGLRQTGSPNLNPVSEACQFSSGLPDSLRSDFDSYVTSVMSFVSASSSEIDALITNCVATGAQGARYTSLINSFATHTGPLCTGGAAGPVTTATTGTQTTAVTGGTSVTGTSTTAATTTTSIPRGEAARPTGVLAGAAAAAGVLGAAILL